MAEYSQTAIEQSERIYSKRLGDINISTLVENRGISLHKIAAMAEDANLTPAETGNLVHRIAQLRTLRHHAKDVLSGTKYVEMRINDQHGGAVELDLVTIRGTRHYIHDYKPINIRDIQDKPWASDFVKWLTHKHNGDYSQIGNFRSMPPSLHANFREFLRDHVQQYRKQLENYRNIYSKHFGISPEQVKTSVIPYYVNR